MKTLLAIGRLSLITATLHLIFFCSKPPKDQKTKIHSNTGIIQQKHESKLLVLSKANPGPVKIGDDIEISLINTGKEPDFSHALNISEAKVRDIDNTAGFNLLVSPVIEINGTSINDAFLMIEIDSTKISLPGGIEEQNIFGAIKNNGKWEKSETFFNIKSNSISSIIPAKEGKFAFFADARNFIPACSKSEGLAGLIASYFEGNLINKILYEDNFNDFNEVNHKKLTKLCETGSNCVIYYLEAKTKKVISDSNIFFLVPIKKARNSEPFPSDFIAIDRTGNVIKNAEILRNVLLSARVANSFNDKTASNLLKILETLSEKINYSIREICSGNFFNCLMANKLRRSTDDIKAVIISWTKQKETLKIDDAKTFLQNIISIIEINNYFCNNEGDSRGEHKDRLCSPEFIDEKFLSALKDSSSSEELNNLTDIISRNIRETEKKLSQLSAISDLEKGKIEEITSKILEIWKYQLNSKVVSSVISAIGYSKINQAISAIASSKFEKAPYPETRISKHKLLANTLYLYMDGTDKDGKISGFKYWIDDSKVPKIIKGSRFAKIELKTLSSGLHTFYSAAIDDDGQEDESPAKFPFYIRRFVDISISRVNASFDGPSSAINSEHQRSAIMYAKEIEASISTCSEEKFRFGIDGKGNVKVAVNFRGNAPASLPVSRKIVSASYKNEALIDCILKALKTGKLRYAQPWRPPAHVEINYLFEPRVLFFDSTVVSDLPTKDTIAAAVFDRCVGKGDVKIESFCNDAVSRLPVPGDKAENNLTEEETAENFSKNTDQNDNDNLSSNSKINNNEANDKKHQTAIENIKQKSKNGHLPKIPEFEFDPFDVKKECIRLSIKYLVAKCSSSGSNKKKWCIDSCEKLANNCEKKCKGQSLLDTDPNQCMQDCWSNFMLNCSRNCMLKNTPFEEKDAG